MTATPAQPYPQQPAPPKKRRTWLIVLIVVLALGALLIGGCVALLGGAAKSVSDAVASASADPNGSGGGGDDRNAPRTVKVGEQFTLGSHQTLKGWKVAEADFDSGFEVTGKVKNVSDKTSTAFLHFKFIDKKGEVLGNVQCNSSDLEPGQTQKLNCIPDGEYGKFAKVTVEATF